MAPVHEQTSDPWKPRSTLLGTLLVNRYRISQLIGQGSTGAVYRADDVLSSKPVAVRVLIPALAQQPGLVSRVRARIDRNAEITKQHPEALINLVDTIDVGITLEGEIFVVTDFLEGDHLSSMLARGGRLPWSRARHLFVRLCQLIHGFHQHGIVLGTLQARHCYAVRGRPKAEAIKIVNTAILEQLGGNLGPGAGAAGLAMARYIAPEQACGEPVDARSDVYSFGVIAYELLTGRPPFDDANVVRLVSMHLQTTPQPPRQVAAEAEIPVAVEQIVLKALAKAPADRHASMEAFAAALSAVPEQATAAAVSPAPPPPVSLTTPSIAAPPVAPPRAASSPIPAAPPRIGPPGASPILPAPPPIAPPVVSTPKISPSVVMRPLEPVPGSSAPAPAVSIPSTLVAPPKRPPSIPMPAAVIPPLRRGSGALPAAAPAGSVLTALSSVVPGRPELSVVAPPSPAAAATPEAAAAPVATPAPADAPADAAAPVLADTRSATPLAAAFAAAGAAAAAEAAASSASAPAAAPVPADTRPVAEAVSAAPVPADTRSAADAVSAAPVPADTRPVAEAVSAAPVPADTRPAAEAASAAPVPADTRPAAADTPAANTAPAAIHPRAAAAAATPRPPVSADIPPAIHPRAAASAAAAPAPSPLSEAPALEAKPLAPETKPPAPRRAAEVSPAELRTAALRQATEKHPSLSQVGQQAPSESILAELPRRRVPWVAIVGVGAAIAAGAAAYIQTQSDPAPSAGRVAQLQPASPPRDIKPTPAPTVVARAPDVEPAPERGDAVLPPSDPPPADPPPPEPEAKAEPDPQVEPEHPEDKPGSKTEKKKKKKTTRASVEPEEEEEDVFDQLRKHMEAKKAAEAARAAGTNPTPTPAPAPTPVPPKVDDDAARARDTLDRARQAASQGNNALAYSLAKQSYTLAKTGDALELMGVSACKAGNADNARSAANQLSGSRRSAIVDACSKNGITL